MRKNIERLLFESGLSGNKIANITGVPQSTVSRFLTGESKLDNMKLATAETLYNYYINNKEMLEMENIVNEIRKKYKVDGENERYIEIYNNADEVLEEQDKEQFEERFLSGYVQKTNEIKELNYPIITFDYSGDADGKLFEANEDEEDVLNAASEFFESK